MGALKTPLGLLLAATLCAGCAPREILLPAVGLTPPALRDFPPGYTPPYSSETEQPMPGFGGSGPLTQTPILFVHGNTVSARYWLPARRHWLEQGVPSSALWALGYGWDNVRYFDSADLSVESLDRMVTSVLEHLSRENGRTVHQLDLIGHSLGVTLVRQWLKQTNSWHKVRNFIGAAGANDGVWTASADSRGQNRGVAFELHPGSPWLAQLNRGGETPGPTRYLTLYDGTGWGDVLFPPGFEDSSALEGADNLAYNRVHGTHFDHLELPRVPETLDAMLAWLREAPEPLPQASPPRVLQSGDQLRPEPAEARLHCATQGRWPHRRSAALAEVRMSPRTLYHCYARHPQTHLSSPIGHFFVREAATGAGPLTLSASVPAGAYEQPLEVALSASDPAAWIVYSTAGRLPESGAPLYQAPVYIAGPLTLVAQAFSADGRVSEPLSLRYDISLELIDARHALRRQFEADAEPDYAARRGKGR
ncbi:MAG TPA: chitobiase/beta-hexosaminidase C-terminal domain-containing protein [Nevskiaceae bacterium]|nr:chitobiase/beta-hexosaminidase C-terminal domain-containing protein [Nevskiaceae bacterium]